jgi:hypothetical protein
LLVVALFGLITGLAVTNFDQIQTAFAGYKQNPIWLLNASLQRARLLASRQHRRLFLGCGSQGLQVEDCYGKVIEAGDWPKDLASSESIYEFYQGKYSNSGKSLFSYDRVGRIEISQEGCLSHVYVKIKRKDAADYFRIHLLSGELAHVQV